jgi:YfiH family protein
MVKQAAENGSPLVESAVLASLGRVRHGFGIPPHTPLAPWRPRQVHGTSIQYVAHAGQPKSPADAVLTDQPHLPVGIVTADCVPLLLAHPDDPRVMAVHAGWRGLAAGFLDQIAIHLGAVGGWRVGIGPAADACCYEVGPEVIAALGIPPGDVSLTQAGHGRISLRRWASSRLVELGFAPEAIELVGGCTICSARWPSYRRDGDRAGRLVSWIERCEPCPHPGASP